MEVVRLIVGVVYGPQLSGTGSDHGVDARHVHLLTVDLSAVELERSPGSYLIKPQCRTGLEALRESTSLSQGIRGAELQQVKMIIAAGAVGQWDDHVQVPRHR